MQYQKEEVRKRILDVAFAEFEREGYYKANMLRIATRAKVPIGNLYRYFNGKSVLFDALVGEAAAVIPEFVKMSYQQNAEGIEGEGKSEQIRNGILAIFERYGREFMLLLDRSQGSKFSEFGNALCKEICNLWKQAFSRGEEDELMIEILAEGFISGSLKVFRLAEASERAALVDRLMKFYFQNIKDRI